jgi:hypothetical protein
MSIYKIGDKVKLKIYNCYSDKLIQEIKSLSPPCVATIKLIINNHYTEDSYILEEISYEWHKHQIESLYIIKISQKHKPHNNRHEILDL